MTSGEIDIFIFNISDCQLDAVTCHFHASLSRSKTQSSVVVMMNSELKLCISSGPPTLNL